jgi:hypothetical protein
MNPESASQTPAPRRRIWRWVLLATGLCLAPLLVLGAVVLSYLTLDGDVRTLRSHVMAATDARWTTKVQMSVGGVTLGAVREGLRFVHHKDIGDARLALSAVKHASVGVYELASGHPDCSRERLFEDTDRAMARRGWTRLVGVADTKETVLIYVQKEPKDNEPIDLCLAVVGGRELVVVSTTVDPDVLGELVERHGGEDMKRHLHFARLSQ